MKYIIAFSLVLISGCSISKTYKQPPELASVPGKVIYCETQSVVRECGYMTKAQERELRNVVDGLFK